MTCKPDVVTHLFVGNDYAKMMRIQRGETAISHLHRYDHDSMLAIGTVKVTCDGMARMYQAPEIIRIKAGVEHEIFALSDVLWLCIHENTEKLTNPDHMDEVLIAPKGA